MLKKPKVKAKVEVVASTEKETLIAYIEELKRKDAHEYAVREVELLRKLNQL